MTPAHARQLPLPIVNERADILLVDAKHALYRSADAFNDLSIEDDDGVQQTGAIYGWLMIVSRVHREIGGTVIACWDTDEGPSARRAIYPAYKEREPFESLPEQQQIFFSSMREQMPKLQAVLSLLGIHQYSAPGWEADDVMGTLAERFTDPRRGARVAILTGDRDLLQLVNESITVYRPAKEGALIVETPATVERDWGVPPKKFVSMKALAGESGDNIPGVRGIGPKKAAALIQVYGDLNAVIDAALEVSSGRRKVLKGSPMTELVAKAIERDIHDVVISARLAAINRSVALIARPVATDHKRAHELFMNLKFFSLFREGRFDLLKSMGQV